MEPVVSSFHLKRNLDEELSDGDDFDDNIEGVGSTHSKLVAAGAIEPPMLHHNDAGGFQTPPSIHDSRVKVLSQLTDRISPAKKV